MIERIPEPISNPKLTEEFIQQWMDTKIVSVDIETDFTLIPENHTSQLLYWNEDGTHKANSVSIGTSYAAPITDVAIMSPGLPPVVFDMRGYTIYSETPDPYVLIVSQFLAQLLSRPKITIVGHNVVFDLRQLGGHYDFEIHIDSMVWGTQVMGIRLMMAEDKAKGAFGTGFSLLELSRHLGIVRTGTPTFNFLNLMKKHVRANVSDVFNAVEQSDNPEHFWDYLGGKPDNEEDQIKLAQKGVELYVFADAYLAYQLHKVQAKFIKTIARKDTNIKVWMKFPSGEREMLMLYPAYPEVKEHAELWQHQMRLAANWSIRGIPFDTGAALARQSRAEKRFYGIMSDMPVLSEEDDDDNFRIVYDTLVWYDMVVKAINKRAATGKMQGVENWKPHGEPRLYWNRVTDIDEEQLRVLLNMYLEVPEKMKDFWINLLVKLKPSEHYTNTRIAKLIGDINLPKAPTGVDTTKFSLDYFSSAGEQYVDIHSKQWKAICRDRWLRYLIAQRELVTPHDLWGKMAWKPYFIFVVSKMPLPFDEDFHQNFDLATDTIKRKARSWTDRTRNYGEPAPYRDFLIEQRTGLSFNREAMDFYIKEIERDEALDLDTEPFKLFKEVSEADGLIARVTEFLAHASVDGRIHSIVIPGTRTGRDRSSSPNVQNLKMAKSKDFGHKYTFAGLVVAEGGFWFIELDYSNAENKTGAMIARDNLFAMATEFGDFHLTMAMKYWPHLDWDNMSAAERTSWRKKGKIITFGTAYGMGAVKLAAKLKVSLEEARQILLDKDRAYPDVARAKAMFENRIEKMAASPRLLLPYAELWDKQRVAIPRYIRPGENFEVPAYKDWNFRQQGGVSVLIHRAAVAINRMLQEGGYKTYIAFNVHDSLILAMHIEEYYNTNVLQLVIQVMVDLMPDEMCNRTSPRIEFVANADIPGNAEKWGYHDTLEYPFPRDEYTDYWGHRVPLPEDEMKKPVAEREAPTRKAGPEWNFDPEAMWKDALSQRKVVTENVASNTVDNTEAIQAYNDAVTMLDDILQETEHPMYAKLDKKRTWQMGDDEITAESFAEHFIKAGVLYARGIEKPYDDLFYRILYILQETGNVDLLEWMDEYRYLIPKSHKSVGFELCRRLIAESQE